MYPALNFPAVVCRWTALLTGSFLLTSCALFHRLPSGAAANRPAPRATAVSAAADTAATLPSPSTATVRRIGTVRVIGRAQRFVLIEVPFTSTVPLPDGQPLRCSLSPDPAAPPTATLRVSPERRRPFIVADVVSGEPHVGDGVFLGARTPPSTTAGTTVLPTATSGIIPILLPAPAPTPKTP